MGNTTFNIGNLFWHAMRKWRVVLATALILAVALGGYQFMQMRGMIGTSGTSATPDAEYYSSMATYTETKATIEATMTTLQSTLDELNTYIDSSLYMQLDSEATARGLIRMHVSAEYEIIDGVATTAIDPVTSVLLAYYYDATLGDIYNVVSEEMDYEIELAYLKDVIFFGYDVTTGYLTATIYGSTTEEVTAITAIVSVYLEDQYETINQDIHEHEIVIMQYIEEPTVISGISANQTETWAELATTEASMAAQQTQLDALVEPVWTGATTSAVVGTKVLLLQAMLWAVLGGIVGLFGSVIVFMILPVVNNKIWDEGFIAEQCKLTVLTKRPGFPTKKTVLDRLVFKMSNKTTMKQEVDFYEYLSTNIQVSLADSDKIHLLGVANLPNMEQLHQNLSDAVQEKTTLGGSVLDSKVSLEQLAQADGVILFVEMIKTSEKELQQEVNFVTNMNKQIKGVVLL